jgi:hypothetical protein
MEENFLKFCATLPIVGISNLLNVIHIPPMFEGNPWRFDESRGDVH